MSSSRNVKSDELKTLILNWMEAWNKHDLDGVMSLFHNNAEFIAWDGVKVSGKRAIRCAWTPWFNNHDNFYFKIDELVVDETNQSVAMTWRLNWLSSELGFEDKKETRMGADFLSFKEGLLLKKHTYSQTSVIIDGNPIQLTAN